MNHGENIEYYAKRKLAELQEVATKVSYTRSYSPFIQVSDTILLNYPEGDFSGKFYVVSQSIDLGYDAKTSEEVIKL